MKKLNMLILLFFFVGFIKAQVAIRPVSVPTSTQSISNIENSTILDGVNLKEIIGQSITAIKSQLAKQLDGIKILAVTDKNGIMKDEDVFTLGDHISFNYKNKKYAFDGIDLTGGGMKMAEYNNIQPINGNEYKVYIGANGDLKTALNGNGNNNSATGSLELRFCIPRDSDGFQVGGAVSVAVVDDTIKSNYGSSLLLPQAGKNSAILDLCYYHYIDKDKLAWLIYGYSFISTTTWQYALNDSISSKSGSIFGFATLLGLQLFKINANNDAAALTFVGGLSFRQILGDLKENTFMAVTNSDKTFFVGEEAGFVAYYKGISAGLTYYNFSKNIQGFSGGQVTGRISFEIDLFEI